jgi:hypothetical protein
VYAADLGTPPTDFQVDRTSRAEGRRRSDPCIGFAEPIARPGPDVISPQDEKLRHVSNDGTISRVPRDGSAPAATLVKNQPHPICVATDETFVYWTDDHAGTISRCALAGCGGLREVLYDMQNVPHALVVDDKFLYWTNRDDTDVVRAPKDGSGKITELAGSRGYPESLVLDHGMLYWVETLTHTIQSMPKDGAPRPIAWRKVSGFPTAS